MTSDLNRMGARYSIEDHAVLFAVLARSALQRMGTQGLEASEKAVVLMGRERGRRCAEQCLASGLALTTQNYFLYIEWPDDLYRDKVEIVSLSPVYNTHTVACAWKEAWEKHGLTEYGRLYCRHSDVSLLEGFNPSLTLVIDRYLTDGHQFCNFVWKDCSFNSEQELKSIKERRRELQPGAIKSVLYQCAHLLSTLQRCYIASFGADVASGIINEGLNQYAGMFGRYKADQIVKIAADEFLKSSRDIYDVSDNELIGDNKA